jgi:hypothetical protein
VTYGTTSAPFLAVSTLQQLAVDEKDQFPLAHAVVPQRILHRLTGADSEPEALDLREQLV